MSENIKKLLDRMKRKMLDEAESVYWTPTKPGEYVWGILEEVVEDVFQTQSGEEIAIKVAKLRDPATGKVAAVRIMHKSLQSLWDMYNPKPGDLVLIKLVKNVYDNTEEDEEPRLRYRVFGMSIRRKESIENIIPVASLIKKRHEEHIQEAEQTQTMEKHEEEEEKEEEIIEEEEETGESEEEMHEDAGVDPNEAKRLAQYTITMLRDFFDKVTVDDMIDFAGTLGLTPSKKLIDKALEYLKKIKNVKVEDDVVRLSS